ncbi:uncharacterized protein I303_102630 [Kwoniella dejecticola CBS 10117]|uniref:Aminoglycoside phosphotransferase domain-containing protein n=1 Tax=Kwoniella dejecticola CBS 10117 TaxID=1296121 RepID=A0A1A6A9A3_9TREE|nr:uncharacterized protein I303_02644 [Kwoniella dejecticola CBS 10117]OBR86635.1 hypothetical protein I303_02644 [Kwoniella dejecticola CBS 10117]
MNTLYPVKVPVIYAEEATATITSRTPSITYAIQTPRKPPYTRVVTQIHSSPRQILAILNNLDLKAIKEEVESLRSPHTCTLIDVPRTQAEIRKLTGSFNTHVVIHFEDGVKWVMRIKRKESRCMPEEAIIQCHKSELATLKTLRKYRVKVPASNEKPVDSSIRDDLLYFYQEFVDGVPSWKIFVISIWDEDLTPAGIRFINDYAAWTLRMEKVISPTAVGCLHDDGGILTVGPHIEKAKNLICDSPFTSGPFLSAKHRWLYSIECRMRLLLEKREYSPSQELLRFLKLLEMQELVLGCAEMDEGPWYLKHNDLHHGNLRVDEETGQLRGVIDWEWASFTCKAEAFAAPPWFGPGGDSASSTDIGKAGEQLVRAYEDLGRPDLGKLVRGGLKYHWLEGSVLGDNTSIQYLNAARRSFLGQPDTIQGEPDSEEAWIAMRITKHINHPGLQILLGRKPTYLFPEL